MLNQPVCVNSSSTQVLEKDAVLAALERSLAMIEFDSQGTVLWVNENFAEAMGYRVEELQNTHHSQFCPPSFVQSPEYDAFWRNLRSGNAFQEKVQRVTKQGNNIWLEATYTPVLDAQGEVEAVVKVATDITAREKGTAKVTHELLVMADNLEKRAQEGITRSHEISSAMNQIVEQTDKNKETIQELVQQAKAIRSMVKTISDISAKTNLLSFNAAIQAANAGEHGRAFSVVAEEVRKLAVQTREATEEVRSNIQKMEEQVQNISEGAEHSEKFIIEGRSQIEQAVQEFMGIGESARRLDAQARDLVEQIQGK